MVRFATRRQVGKVLLLVSLFVSQLLCAMLLHLDTRLTRRSLERWASAYLSKELRGTVDVGQIQHLTTSSVWLNNVALYDAQHRRVATLDRVRGHSTLAGAIYRWLRKREALTVIIESLRVDGVHLRIHPDPIAQKPSLLSALELDPNRASKASGRPGEPYRIAFPNVELGDVSVDSTLPEFVSNSVRLRRLSGELLFTDRGLAISLKRFSLDISEPIAAPLHAFGSLDFRSPNRLWGNFNATIADTPLTVRLVYQARQLEMTVLAPEILPSRVVKWFPQWPLQVPVSASLKTHGPIEDLAVRLELNAGDAHLDAVGTFHGTSIPTANLAIEGKSLDLSALLGSTMSSDLGGVAKLEVAFEDGRPRLRFDGVLHPGRIEKLATPRIDFQGDLDSEGLMLSGRSTDQSLPVRAAIVLRDGVIDIDGQLEGVAMTSIQPTLWQMPCAGVLGARARARIVEDIIATAVDLRLRDGKLGPNRLAQASITANLVGPLRDPAAWSGDAVLSAEGLVTNQLQFDQLTGRLNGDRNKLHIALSAEQPGISKFRFETDLQVANGPILRSGHLALTRGAASLTLQAAAIRFERDIVLLDHLTVDGTAGHLSGSLGLQRGHVFGQLEGDSLDLGVVSDLLNLPPRLLSGHATLAIDADTRPPAASGHLRIGFDRANVGILTNLTGDVEATLTGQGLKAVASCTSDLVDEVHGNFDITLDGPPTHFDSYHRATGNGSLALTQVRLDRIGTLLRLLKDNLDLTGTADVHLGFERQDAKRAPNLTVSAVTHELSGSVPAGESAIRLEGADLQLSGTLLGETGQLQSSWLMSRSGEPKATAHLKGTLPPMREWDAGLAFLSSQWRRLPLEVILAMPHQRLDELTALFGETLGTGEVESTVWLSGPLQEARLVAEVRGSNLLLTSLGNSIAFNAQGLAEFTQSNGELRLLLAAGKQDKTWLQANAVGKLTPCPNDFGCIQDWEGRIEGGVLGLPLQVLPFLSSLGFSGEMRGGISVRRQDGATVVDGVLPVDELRVSGHPLGQTLLHLRGDRDNLIAGAKLIDGGAQIDFEAHIPMQWKNLLPSRRSEVPVHFAARASGYDAGILAPWLDEYITDLEGELDGSIEATYGISAPSGEAAMPHLAMGGSIGLKGGSARIRALGLVVRDVSAVAQATSTATRSTISIPQISASVGDGPGHVVGSSVVELQGLKILRVAAKIDEAKDLPLVANAATLATLDGSLGIEMTPSPSGYDISVNLSRAEIRLPRSSSRQIVGLAENPDIIVLQPLGSESWRRTRSDEDTKHRIRLALGSKTVISRADFNLPITGTPEITIASRVRPTGSIQFEPMGRLQLFGKVFVIDRGSLTFDPEQPSNPKLDVTATWRGPTHLVTARIQGKLEDARLRLSSDPALTSEAQVMALLLGGGAGNDSTTTAGLGVGATLFNEFLSDTALSTVELRTSSDERHANYTAAVPLRENLWFEATYQSPSSSNLPGSTSQRGFSGTVDYRFRRNWSVRTEVGTLGAGADLLWQYRY